MFKKTLHPVCYILLASALIIFSSCGGSESGIESEEEVIAVELTVHDDGDSESTPTFTVDVIRSLCGSIDEETPEEPREETPEETPDETATTEELTPEPFFDTFGNATFYYVFYCPTCPPGADETYIIESYTVEYIPLKSPSGSGGFFYPPKLVNLDKPLLSQAVLSREFTEAQRSIILVTIQTKEEYVKKMLETGGYTSWGDFANPLFGLYSIRVTFHGRNRKGGDLSFTTTTEVSFGNYDQCDE